MDYIYNKAREIRAALYPIFNQHSDIPKNIKLCTIKMYIVTIIVNSGPPWAALITGRHRKRLGAIINIARRSITHSPCGTQFSLDAQEQNL